MVLVAHDGEDPAGGDARAVRVEKLDDESPPSSGSQPA